MLDLSFSYPSSPCVFPSNPHILTVDWKSAVRQGNQCNLTFGWHIGQLAKNTGRVSRLECPAPRSQRLRVLCHKNGIQRHDVSWQWRLRCHNRLMQLVPLQQLSLEKSISVYPSMEYLHTRNNSAELFQSSIPRASVPKLASLLSIMPSAWLWTTFISISVYFLWRLWRFSIIPLLYSGEPKELPYLIPCMWLTALSVMDSTRLTT